MGRLADKNILITGGHLDGIFVNAGYSEFLLFEEVTEQSFDKVIAVNFKGAYFTIHRGTQIRR